ncbi:MAG TPA: hypothetical protein VGM73_05075 [Candidatus Didemnitutus sp.]|jgi:Na+/proline symporter
MTHPFPAGAAHWPLAVLRITDQATIFGVALVFLLSLLCIGLVFRRFNHDSSDYFCAGHRGTWWLVGGSIFMQGFSAWTFTGAAGATYHAGWAVVAMFGSNVLMYLVLAAAPARWFRNLRVITPADTIRLRFGAPMEQLFAYLSLLMGPLFGGVQLYSLAIFTGTLLGIDVSTIIVVLGLVVLFYTAMSGAWAVLAADFIKGLVLLPISVIVAAACLVRVGGITGLFRLIEQANLAETFAPVKSAVAAAHAPGVAPGNFTWAFFAAWYWCQIITVNSLSTSGKLLMVKDGREARRAALLAAVLSVGGMLIFFLPPMTSRLLIPAEVAAMPLRDPAEGAYAAIAMYLLPPGLVGLVLVAMCASTMSALDTGLTGLAGLLTENIHPALCRRLGRVPWQGRRRLLLGRAINFGCAIMVITCALAMARLGSGSVFGLLLSLIAVVTVPVTTPLFWGMFVRGTAGWAAPASVGLGFAVALACAFGPQIMGAEPMTYAGQVAWPFGAASVLFLASRLGPRSRAGEAERLAEEFFSRRDRPVDFAQEVGAANDARQARIVGTFGVALGAAILLLLLPASSTGHHGKIVAAGMSTAALGALLWRRGRRSRVARETLPP